MKVPSFNVHLQANNPHPSPAPSGLPNLQCGMNKMSVKAVLKNTYDDLGTFMDPVEKEKFGYRVFDAYLFDYFLEDITYSATDGHLCCRSTFQNLADSDVPRPSVKSALAIYRRGSAQDDLSTEWQFR
eukprot:gnl/TRDRNA2_/TRDRNA2_174307_c0_seq13.p1 gnl/TRDRNA2_/TRDRNA2_174307_c0~~gnl/TRDRNA2_/TRDRNA2_174307_c0_seq13.p1  ORF type:complete len:128 (+),score=3.03 gnl/TRDRNA2_/TRDRNA2_174307_c0_seq13:542-925(+)